MQKQAALSAWQQPARTLSRESLDALIEGTIPAILIDGFATLKECSAFCLAIRSAGADATTAKTTRMSLIGANFSNYDGNDKAGYFDLVGRSYEAVHPIIAQAGFDPLERMVERLRTIWPAGVETAIEPGFGRYFAGGIKTRSSSGHLHYDFAPHTAGGFAIADITDQLGWNLYLDMPTHSGETTTYRREVPRDGGKIGTGPVRALNLDNGFIEGVEAFTFRPKIGDVAIINTRFPHNITVADIRAGEWRAQISSFIGRLGDNRLILWS